MHGDYYSTEQTHYLIFFGKILVVNMVVSFRTPFKSEVSIPWKCSELEWKSLILSEPFRFHYPQKIGYDSARMAPKTQIVYQSNLLIEFFFKISSEIFEELDVEKPVFSRREEIILPVLNGWPCSLFSKYLRFVSEVCKFLMKIRD